MIIRTSAILQNDALIIAPAGNRGIPKIASSDSNFFRINDPSRMKI